MASDNISLAARRLTYAELGAVRGTSTASAERLVRRRGWQRTLGNDGIVRVTVPLEEARPAKQKASVTPRTVTPRTSSQTVTPRTSGADVMPRTSAEAFASAIDLLAQQLERERSRADRAEARITELLRRTWWRRLIG